MWSHTHAKWALCYFRFLVGRNRRRERVHTQARARATDVRTRWLRNASPRSSRCVFAPCASALASIAPASHAAVVFRGVRASSETNAMARRAAFRAACRVWRRLGNASRTSPRPSPPGRNRANRLTTTIRVFSTRNRISKRIPRRPAAPGRGRTMTFSTGTPPSSDLRTRLTRVAFSSWPFTCVSPPARRRCAPRERDPERASARAGNSDARSARASASTPPVADPAPAPRLSSPAIWQRETEFFVFSPARAGTRRRSLAFFFAKSQAPPS